MLIALPIISLSCWKTIRATQKWVIYSWYAGDQPRISECNIFWTVFASSYVLEWCFWQITPFKQRTSILASRLILRNYGREKFTFSLPSFPIPPSWCLSSLVASLPYSVKKSCFQVNRSDTIMLLLKWGLQVF